MGVSQIIDAILNTAQQDAKKLLDEAGSAAKTALDSAQKNARLRADELLAEAHKTAEISARRDMLVAELESRKRSLQQRRSVLDRVFDSAVDCLCSLDATTYASFIIRLIAQSVETGTEQLQVSAQDRELYVKTSKSSKSLLEQINESLSSAGIPGKLSLYPVPGTFRGGFVVIGSSSDVDCSFESIIRIWRDEHESEIAKMLFAQKED